MSVKSTQIKYGTFAVTLHWFMAVCVLVQIGLGLLAANTLGLEPNPIDSATRSVILKFHRPFGAFILVLLILRSIWWLYFDKKPAPVAGTPRWQVKAARTVHYLFYVVIFVVAASGSGLFLISDNGLISRGEFDAIFGFPLRGWIRWLHGIGAKLMIALIALHVLAALFHHFVRRDGTFARMWWIKKT